MKTKLLFSIILTASIIFSCPVNSQKKNNVSPTYESMWAEIEKAKYKDLPKTIIEKTSKVLDKAQKEKNFSQVMKAWTEIIKQKRNISPDSVKVIDMPDYPHSQPNDIIASAIHNTGFYYNNNSDKNDSICNIIKSGKEILYKTKTSDYSFIMTGNDSAIFHNDMLSIMTFYVASTIGIRDLSVISLFDDVSRFYLEKGNKDAWAIMRTEMFGLEAFNGKLSYQAYTDSIKWILDETKDSHVTGEIEEGYLKMISNDYTSSSISTSHSHIPVTGFKTKKRNYEESDRLLDMIRKAKDQYPEFGINFKMMENLFLTPTCIVSSIGPIDYQHPIVYKLEYENIDNVTIEIRKFDGYTKKHDFKTSGDVMFQHKYVLEDDEINKERKAKNYVTHGELTDSVKLPQGLYVYILKYKNQKRVISLFIPSIQLTELVLPNDKILATVTDIVSGVPVKDATITLQKTEKESETSTTEYYTTDTNGMVEIATDYKQYRYKIQAKLSDDDYTEGLSAAYYGNYRETEIPIKRENYVVLTDRPIYRPGQTVHLSMISYWQQGDIIKVNEKQKCNIYLTKRYKTIETKNVVTNLLGNATCDFTLSKDAEPGRYDIKINNMYVGHFVVEEYKRPTFFVENDGARSNQTSADEKEASFSFGQTINVGISATTFSGVPVQNATVKYKIYSGTSTFRSTYREATQLVIENTTTTDSKGKASIPLPLNKPNEDVEVAIFKVEYTVTNLAGESHGGSYATSVSDKAFYFSFSIEKGTIDLSDNTPITLKAINGNRKEVDAEEVINPRYMLLNSDSSVVYEREWKVGEKIILDPVGAGNYILKASAHDKKGNSITACSNLTLFSSTHIGEQSNFKKPLFFCKSSEVTTSSPATIYFAPAHDSTTVYCIVYPHNNQYYHKISKNIGKKVEKIEIPYKDEYGSGMTVYLYYVKNSNTFYHQFTFTKATPQKDLNVTWKTFRDKLTPGQKEKWTLSIKDRNGKAVNGADLIATLYDSSLDQLASMTWAPVQFRYTRAIPSIDLGQSSQPKNLYCSISDDQPSKGGFYRIFGYLNCSIYKHISPYSIHFKKSSDYNIHISEFEALAMDLEDEPLQGRIAGLDIVKNSGNLGTGTKMRARSAAKMPMAAQTVQDLSFEESADNDQFEEEEEEISVPQVNIRKDFSETAFFFPSLISNKDGEVDVEFTLPETLTEWHFMGFVHTADMDNGTISAKAVARQLFMVRPNMPRFIREGDKASISTLIINQSEDNLSGEAFIRILNAETEEVMFTSRQPFTVGKDSTVAVAFSLKDLKSKEEPYICEISATTSTFSDGERNQLVILPSDQKLYETVPFYIESEKEKSIDLASLFNNHSQSTHDKQLSLSFTPNPALLVVDALENMKVSEESNAPSFAASLYANTMLKNLAALVPDYKKEHPAYSDDSTEFYLRLAEDRLAELQNKDGSWSWFKGMTGSYYMTLAVCENLALLSAQQMAVFDTSANNNSKISMLNVNTQRMLNAGLDYLDEIELEIYKDYKKVAYKKDRHPSQSTLQYINIYTLLPDRQIRSNVKKMINTYLKAMADNSKDLSIYGKSRISKFFRHFNMQNSADQFLQSIIEYTVTQPGMGRYFDTRKAQYSWRDYKIPTHIAAMQAIAEKTGFNTDKMLNEMTLWLFRQKQVQKWDNPMNTVEVVDYLLKSNSSSLSSGYNLPVTFSLDGKDINAGDTLKVDNVNSLHISRLAQDIRQASRVPKISWGAVAASFYEKTANIKSSALEEGFKVSYQLLNVDGKPITKAKVGDQVTLRVTVTADRDMDFVKITAQHPGCFEQVNQLTGYHRTGHEWAYVVNHDSSTDINCDTFTKGTHKFDINFYVERPGIYNCGIATALCTYCPDYTAHSGSQTITVEE